MLGFIIISLYPLYFMQKKNLQFLHILLLAIEEEKLLK